jgi:ElaB/YqjD/DUF883 family membrane-anchored ribosome-binding protein
MAEDMADRLADVKKSLEKLTNQVSKMAGTKLEAGMEEGEEMMETAKAGVRQAVKVGKAKTAEVNAMVEDNPWLAVAVFSLAALAVGHVLGQSSRKE